MLEKNLKHGNHTLSDRDLLVSRAPPEVVPDEKQENEGRTGNEVQFTTNAILVDGLKPWIEKEILELFFENQKRSGGGEIQNIQMYQKSGRAIIWFADQEGRFFTSVTLLFKMSFVASKISC